MDDGSISPQTCSLAAPFEEPFAEPFRVPVTIIAEFTAKTRPALVKEMQGSKRRVANPARVLVIQLSTVHCKSLLLLRLLRFFRFHRGSSKPICDELCPPKYVIASFACTETVPRMQQNIFTASITTCLVCRTGDRPGLSAVEPFSMCPCVDWHNLLLIFRTAVKHRQRTYARLAASVTPRNQKGDLNRKCHLFLAEIPSGDLTSLSMQLRWSRKNSWRSRGRCGLVSHQGIQTLPCCCERKLCVHQVILLPAYH